MPRRAALGGASPASPWIFGLQPPGAGDNEPLWSSRLACGRRLHHHLQRGFVTHAVTCLEQLLGVSGPEQVAHGLGSRCAPAPAGVPPACLPTSHLLPAEPEAQDSEGAPFTSMSRSLYTEGFADPDIHS